MELKHIALPQLSVSTANMRAKGKTPDIANSLGSCSMRDQLDHLSTAKQRELARTSTPKTSGRSARPNPSLPHYFSRPLTRPPGAAK